MDDKRNKVSLFKGLFFAVLSGVSFSIVSVFAKQMKNLHPGQLAMYKFIANFVMCLPVASKTGQNLLGPPGLRFFLILRGILGGFCIFLNFIAFRYLGLGEASVIILSSPVVITIFARVFFKEPCNMIQSITVMLTFVGIIFTTKLPSRLTEIPAEYSSEKIYGLSSAIFSLFCVSAVHLITRKIRSVHQDIMNLSYSCVGILVTAFLTGVFGNFKWHYCGIQSVYVLLLALSSYSAITFVVLAFQCEYAGPVSTVRAAADIGLAFVWQIVIFHDVPDSYGIIGAVLILVSIVLIGLNKWIASLEGNFFSCVKCKLF